MIKLTVPKKKWSYDNVSNIFVSVWGLEILFPNLHEDINCKSFLWLHRLRSVSYLQYETNHICQQSRSDFAFFTYSIKLSQSLINADIFFYLYDKVLILKRFLILSNANTKIWSRKRVLVFFSPVQMKGSGCTGVWNKII